MNYPPLTTAALTPISSLTPFSEVVPAEKMAELEAILKGIETSINSMMADDNCPHDAYLALNQVMQEL